MSSMVKKCIVDVSRGLEWTLTQYSRSRTISTDPLTDITVPRAEAIILVSSNFWREWKSQLCRESRVKRQSRSMAIGAAAAPQCPKPNSVTNARTMPIHCSVTQVFEYNRDDFALIWDVSFVGEAPWANETSSAATCSDGLHPSPVFIRQRRRSL